MAKLEAPRPFVYYFRSSLESFFLCPGIQVELKATFYFKNALHLLSIQSTLLALSLKRRKISVQRSVLSFQLKTGRVFVPIVRDCIETLVFIARQHPYDEFWLRPTGLLVAGFLF